MSDRPATRIDRLRVRAVAHDPARLPDAITDRLAALSHEQTGTGEIGRIVVRVDRAVGSDADAVAAAVADAVRRSLR